jgi:hypothetical protein
VLNTPGHYDELALFYPKAVVFKLHSKSALNHEEKFILVIVVVPYKWTLELDQLDLLTIQIPDDLRFPMVRE